MNIEIEVNKPTYELLVKKAHEMREKSGVNAPDKELITDILDQLVDYLDKVDV